MNVTKQSFLCGLNFDLIHTLIKITTMVWNDVIEWDTTTLAAVPGKHSSPMCVERKLS